jgi:hypothetical protein
VLGVEGTVFHPMDKEAVEYCVVVSVRNARGHEVARSVVNVGALQPGDERTFSFSVDVFPPEGSGEAKR